MDLTQITKYANRLYGRASLPINCNSIKLEEQDQNVIRLVFGNNLIKDTYFINFERKVSYGGNLFVDPIFRGKGFGKKLIQIREEINKSAGVNLILINLNLNDGFWEHMDYKKSSFEEQERFRDILERKVVISCQARYKQLN
jgi:GNAT superfamily N-acetyltransferase